MLDRAGENVKVPIFIQSGIHGNESEGVDTMFELVERLVTTPYGADPEVDAILNHVILLWNVDQNPDGRILGQRGNGNNFDLNRDFLAQSQSETKAAISIMQEWLPPDMLDMHGYVTSTLIESTTKPHNPSIDYDLWLKWNPARIDANEAAMNAAGFAVTRPILDWCADGNPPPAGGLCANGQPPGPSQAEGWDDRGPFYTPMYSQLVGLNGSTVEMCNQCASPGLLRAALHDPWLLDARISQGLRDPARDRPAQRRGGQPAGRLAAGQRHPGRRDEAVDDLRWQDLRQGLLCGVDDPGPPRPGGYRPQHRYERLRADQPALCASGGLESRLPVGRRHARHPARCGLRAHYEPRHQVQSPAGRGGAWRGRRVSPEDRLTDGGPHAQQPARRWGTGQAGNDVLHQPTAETLPAGSAIFATDPATKVALASIGRTNDVWFTRAYTSNLPATEPIERVPRIAVLTGSVNQDVWSLRYLGFIADPIATGFTSQLNNPAAANPLDQYDIVFNTAVWPTSNNPAQIPTTSGARLQAFFAGGGGYIGALTNGASFLTSAGQVSGLTAASRSGSGRSGIVQWNNEGGVNSPIFGAFPAQDTAIMDPPTWFTAIPATMTVDGRLPQAGYFLAGLWQPDAQSATAPNSPVIAHGTNLSGSARLTIFAMNPLYRADPEREWVMLASAAYWADK